MPCRRCSYQRSPARRRELSDSRSRDSFARFLKCPPARRARESRSGNDDQVALFARPLARISGASSRRRSRKGRSATSNKETEKHIGTILNKQDKGRSTCSSHAFHRSNTTGDAGSLCSQAQVGPAIDSGFSELPLFRRNRSWLVSSDSASAPHPDRPCLGGKLSDRADSKNPRRSARRETSPHLPRPTLYESTQNNCTENRRVRVLLTGIKKCCKTCCTGDRWGFANPGSCCRPC
jgi:hypothetical protein